MSALFNHACRYELFDRNPIYLVRQSAKRRTPPATLVPAEIKALIDGLALRERTLVLLAASTGLRQVEIFGLNSAQSASMPLPSRFTPSPPYARLAPAPTKYAP